LIFSWFHGWAFRQLHPVEFLTAVANLEANHANVNLVGLAQAGIEYTFG